MSKYVNFDLIIRETDRLYLVKPNELNITNFYNSINDIDSYFRGLCTYNKNMESILTELKYWDKLSYEEEQHFIIRAKETNEYIGHIWYANGNSIGYGICERERRKGYCLEAVLDVVDYMFDELENSCILLSSYSWNTDSINVAKKAGFLELHRYMYVDNSKRFNEVIEFIKFR